uniref:Uncharacterized protein n=1 Tax=Anguilla anguilla TaxID=7936 RepID=A0A0E9SBK6_ANGAN
MSREYVQSSVFNDLNGECRKFSFTRLSPRAIEERCKSSLFLYKSLVLFKLLSLLTKISAIVS